MGQDRNCLNVVGSNVIGKRESSDLRGADSGGHAPPPPPMMMSAAGSPGIVSTAEANATGCSIGGRGGGEARDRILPAGGAPLAPVSTAPLLGATSDPGNIILNTKVHYEIRNEYCCSCC